MQKIFFVVVLGVAMSGWHWQGAFTPSVVMALEPDDGSLSDHAQVWLLDRSDFTLDEPSSRGVKVCYLGLERRCEDKIEYRYHAAKEFWHLWKSPKPAQDRFVFVVVEEGAVVGTLPIPALSPNQIFGIEPLQIEVPVAMVTSLKKSELERMLTKLEAWPLA